MTATSSVPPRHWSVPPSDVLLADGSIAVIRSLRADDQDEVLALHEGVSEDTLRMRFFTPSPAAGRAYVAHLFDESNTESVALVAVVRGRIAALATAELLSSERAEVAFLVSDQDRGRGLGSLLLEHLAALGRAHGLGRFEAEVLADNYGMLGVFRGAGFAESRRAQDGEVLVELRTDASAAAIDAADRREWRSEARSLRPLLYAESVAVVGVRRDGGGLGFGVLEAIRSGGFTGRLHLVHPEADSIGDLPTDRSLAAIGDPVDLVVIVVPGDQVMEVMADAVAAGVGAAVVISSGVSRPGSEAGAVRRDLLQLARANSVRLVGPNSQGVLAHAAGVRLNATVARGLPAPGGLAVATQSGGVGFTLLDIARTHGVGVHAFVSLGAKLDVSSNDLLAAWMDDDEVAVAALHLESFGNALKFARTARRFAERKPLLAVVGGRRSTASAVGVDALFAQSGVIACGSATEMAEAAALLVQQPLPDGYRVGVVTNAGGMGVLVADIAHAEGLAVPRLSPTLQTTLGQVAPGSVGSSNPVDLGADLAPDDLGACLRTLDGSDEVDAVVVLLVPTILADPAALRAAVARAGTGAAKPILLVASDAAGEPPEGVTLYRTGEAAVRALGHAMRYAAWRRVPIDQPTDGLGPRSDFARAWATTRLAAGGGDPEWLPAEASAELLAPYGIEQVGVLANDPEEAGRAAEAIGYPVALKVADPTILHKTDRGLVRVGLRSAPEVAAAVGAFRAELRTDSVDVRVQPVLGGVEVACGLVRDEVFGPLVRVAAGGVATEILMDEVHLLPPIATVDAARALRGLRLWPLLDGYRGSERLDVESLEALVVAVGQLAADVPQVSDLDLNPLVVTPDGVHCVDVKVRLQAPASMDAGVPRRLRL